MLAAGIVLTATAGSGVAQEKPKLKENQEVIDTRSVATQNKRPSTPQALNSEGEAPIETRAGAVTCDVVIDNQTRWIIHRIYIDRRSWGSVGRYGDAIARDVASGATELYAEADFTNGSTHTWGPTTVNCNRYSTFTWHLWP